MTWKEHTFYFRERVGELKAVKPVRIGGYFVLVGLILFHFVWWPIQAERAQIQLRGLLEAVADKKSELNTLRTKYQAMTALAILDQWAKSHGPWVTPSQNDIITISN